MSEHKLEVEQGNAWETKAGRNYIGYCDSCSSPDETGDGAVEFFGGTLSEVVEKYEDHVRGEN